MIMHILIIWICATAALDDCKGYAISKPIPLEQCENMKPVYAEVLAGQANYYMNCEVQP